MHIDRLSTLTEGALDDDGQISAAWNHQLFSSLDADNLVRSTNAPDHLVTLFKQIKGAGPQRDLIPVPENYRQLCERLAERFPNFAKHIEEYLVPDLALEHIRCGAVKLSPTLFVGPPGVGKTMFAEAFAAEFSLPFERINLEASQAGFELVGSSRGWSSADVGRIFRRLVTAKVPTNALFAFEELDKARGDDRFSISAVLLQLLEPSTSKQFTDQAAPELALDIRPTNFFFTANSLNGIHDALLSRMLVVEVPPLTKQQARQVALNQYKTLVESLGLGKWAPLLTDEAIDQLSTHAPRQQRLLLRLAIGRAIAKGASEVVLSAGATGASSKIGFY